MDRYAIKLTIGGLTGAFAEKYARVVQDAQFLDALLQASTRRSPNGPLTLLARHPEPAEFDGFALLPRLMTQLRKVTIDHAERPFFTGVRLVPEAGEPGPWQAAASGTDDQGPFTIEALGRRCWLVRPPDNEGDEPSRTRIADDGDAPGWPAREGRFEIRRDTRHALFRDDLEMLVNLCEEVLAKNQLLIATVIGTDEAVRYLGAPSFVE